MIILDSSVWVAFFNKDDTQHKKAKKVLREIDEKLIVTEYILLEVSSVLCVRTNKKVADRFLEVVMNNEDIDILASNKVFMNDVVDKFLDHQSKHFSFTDISLVHLSDSYKVITFDKKLDKIIKN